MSDPKVQSWMFRAAQDVLAEDWDKRLKEICEERGGGPEFNVRAMIFEAASIIARHAPDPASVPIGPGDVVQTQRGDIYIVNGLNERGGAHVGVNFFGTTLPLTYLTRIGRAVYWPDGTKVEEAK